MQRKKTVCLDFDGVLHSYTSGWRGADVIPDPPVPGAIAFLRQLVADPRFDVVIYSSRSVAEKTERVDEGIGDLSHWVIKTSRPGIDAMRSWLRQHQLEDKYIERIVFVTEKPPAHLTIDDRAVTFEGTFPTLEFIDRFKPWNKR